ncbi:MAG: S9 family peptidase [Bacteroidia bacterium]|nr:S9 family peptidase [Bacteroidia bacterium]
MKKNLLLLLLSTLFLQLGYAQNKPAFSRMDVFELEWVTQPKISPDGSKIVYERRSMDIMTDRRISRLWLMDSDGSNHVKLSSQDVRESNPSWSPDGSRIAFVSSAGQGSEIYIYWVETAKIARLTQLDRSPRSMSWSPDGKHLAFLMHVPEANPTMVRPPKKPKGAKWANPPRVTTRLKHEADGAGFMEPGYRHIFVVSAEGGTARQISMGNRNYGAPKWSADGRSMFFAANLAEDWAYDFRNSEIYRMDVNTGVAVALTDRKGPDRSPTVSPNGKMIAYTGFDDKVQTYQISRLYVMNTDGSKKKEVKTGLDRSIQNPSWSSDGKGIYFQYDDKGNTKIAYTSLSGKVEDVTSNVGGTGVARPYGGGSFSVSKEGEIAFTHTTPYHPSELALTERGKGEGKMLSDLNADILPYRELGQVEEIWWKSSFDERDVQGWIVKPPQFDPNKKYPLIVENHGGPIANYGDRFSPEMQLYASAGYVVFYPNPRGSTSYGEEFGNLLYHNYPGNDYDDVMSGVDAMVKTGYIDEDNLFVTGGSAGGIMTAWIIGKNNRFKASAVIKPVMNWISKTLTADNYYGYANSRYPGQPWENPEIYMKFSPISLVGNVETPTMVMVGTSDLRTPLSEAKQLYHALKIRKIETALVEVPGAFHFIANRPSQLITKIDHIVAWFDKYRN